MNTDTAAEPSASKCTLGARQTNEGFTFAVWAPHADSVSVVGDFNDWKEDAHPMESVEGGNWTACVESAEQGQRYKYRITTGDRTFDRVDPRALKVENSIGAGIIWQPSPDDTPAFVPPSLDQLVVYELHIGSFALADEAAVGTFEEAMGKLDYLSDLGINAIEIMPVSEFAGDLSWGYNPAHPYAVESAYGGPEAFLAFVQAAHAKGIAVILDVVYNHFGPSDLDLWQFDGWEENGKGGIYFFNDHRSETPWGDTRPDYGRQEVRDYLIDNALMWLDIYKVDGLRLDMTLFIRSTKGNPDDPNDDLKEGWSLMQELNDAVRHANPRAILLAEDLRDSEWLVKDTGAGGAGFSSQWCAAFVHPVRAALSQPADEDRSLESIEDALTSKFDNDAFKRVVYSESHDEVANGSARLPSEIDAGTPDSLSARKRSLLGAVLVMTAPGIPMLFQGQEFLEDEWFRDNVPLRWEKLDTYSGIHRCYRDLVHLRKNREEKTAGLTGQHIQICHFDPLAKTLAYHRWRESGPNDSTLIVVNFSHELRDSIEVEAPDTGTWVARFNSDATCYGDDFQNEGQAEAQTFEPEDREGQSILKIALAGYSAVILSQES
ncbi:alpha-amylase family glycosyl hydrolase [Pelagicoccus sp. SDUM812002]|uniref:alpha-amylase family glycosyl hydrolase n=1 Tax=Pelagicoccus sp. SDUM812002 TaxID=3041266 RepID=UPI00280D3155|nr:alpha-amylase family glycosyl hydrolase [Pelagicoccus sp. SDUM812002]MDQ8188290.1 alpha-amylase family glycosyl hydrolase [Pelagicoccus sp. SDUM812002]